MKRKLFNGCLVGRGRGKKYGRSRCFLSGSTKIFSLQNGENLEEKTQCIKKTRIPMSKCTWVFVSIASFFSLLIFIPVCCTVILLLYIYIYFFGYQKISSSLFNFAIFFFFIFYFFVFSCTSLFFLVLSLYSF